MKESIHPQPPAGKKRGGRVVVVVEGKTVTTTADRLRDDDHFDRLARRCREAAESATVKLPDLLALADQDVVKVFDFLAAAGPAHVKVGNQVSDDLLTAVLKGVHPGDDHRRQEAAQRIALLAAVMSVPGPLEPACTAIAQQMKTWGVTVRVASIAKEAQRLREKMFQGGGHAQGVRVRAVLADAPAAEALTVPAGWRLAEGGIRAERRGEDDAVAVPAPVLIVERCRDAQRGTEAVRLAWRRDGRWAERVVDRAVIADARAVINLAAYGVPVTSNNAKTLVQYLADFEAANLAHLPPAAVSRQMGWQGEDRLTFLWGAKPLSASDADDEVAPVRFLGGDEGEDQIAAGFRAGGTRKGWREAAALARAYPRVRLAVYAALVPPLLPLLGAPGFVLDWAGPTTGGKTTTLRLAASVWGNPDESSGAGAALSTWDGTAVWRERAPAVINHLPFVLDDTKRARRPEDVARTIYEVVQGRGRGRGTVKGLARQETWQTVLLTSGEQPATTFTQDGGTRARVLMLWGPPFGATDATTGEVARQLNQELRLHFGHAGPQFVRYLLDGREDWEAWRAAYQERVLAYEARAGANAVAGRMAPYFAALATAADLAHQALDLPWPAADPVADLWAELTQDAAEADRAAAALRAVMSWAYAHQEMFFCRRESGPAGQSAPIGGWAGRWDRRGLPNRCDEMDRGTKGKEEEPTWDSIAFLPTLLAKVLRDEGFEPDPVLRTWRDRGWLVTSSHGGVPRAQVKRRVGAETPWLIAVTREAVIEVGSG